MWTEPGSGSPPPAGWSVALPVIQPYGGIRAEAILHLDSLHPPVLAWGSIRDWSVDLSRGLDATRSQWSQRAFVLPRSLTASQPHSRGNLDIIRHSQAGCLAGVCVRVCVCERTLKLSD